MDSLNRQLLEFWPIFRNVNKSQVGNVKRQMNIKVCSFLLPLKQLLEDVLCDKSSI